MFRRWTLFFVTTFFLLLMEVSSAIAGEVAKPAQAELGIRDLFAAGGSIGWLIVLLSLLMVSLIVEHIISLRRSVLIPQQLAEEVHSLVSQNQIAQAEQLCSETPSFLGRVLSSGLKEIPYGYASVEKSMEDTSLEQAGRLFRKIEYLSIISTIAPMLGLMGTVWGMIVAFLEFQTKANPQVAELAPGIYKALVTTLMGLGVAVPALATFAIFRNRIDGMVAEATLLAEHVFEDFKRAQHNRRVSAARKRREAE
ncbi:MotA/TolQ/ExbB proton channel family protein [hydrothermal vent metagenome]|uniref:MotA/TolQ/ExbB proton channel family protein n=1 Tax=hydrothermal vent metagenome TaxID=652676 RepID=A0A3B1D8Y6_9ZZZZ